MPINRPDRSLGKGQTWQNMTAQRVKNTDYTNNTGRAIAVSINTVALQDTGDAFLMVDGKQLSFYQCGVQIPNDATHQAIVPHGSVYRLEMNIPANVAVGSWLEMS